MNTVLNKSAKMVLAGIAIAALSANVYARDYPDCDKNMQGKMSGHHDRMEKMRAEHLNSLHEELKLTPQQESAWRKFTTSHSKAGKTARMDRAEMKTMSTPQRLEKRLDHMRMIEKKMTGQLAALKEFYAVLTPEQQKVFDTQTSRMGARGHHGDRHGK